MRLPCRAYAEIFYSLPKPDWKFALAAWQHFAEISRQQDFVQTNLARVHLKLGQKDAARACLAKVQGADFQQLKEKLSRRLETERPSSPTLSRQANFSRKPGIDDRRVPP